MRDMQLVALLAAALLCVCAVEAEHRTWGKQKHWRLRNMTTKSDPMTRKSEPLASKSDHMTTKTDPMSSKSDHITSESGPMTSKSHFMTSKSDPMTIKPSTTKMTTTMTSPSELTAHTEQTLTAPVPVREDAEAEELELGMTERLDEKRFQEAENRRANLYLQDEHFMSDTEEDPGNGACLYVHCSAGRVCETDEHGEAVCSCIKECPVEAGTSRVVCTNHNETWPSDCKVYQHRCLCLDGSELCRGPQYYHMHVEYYGACRKKRECTEKELREYPQHMREWLFSNMRDLSERRELTPHYLALAYETQSTLMQRWTNTAIWKWCDIHADDVTRFVSVHELYPISSSLIALGHCAAPFLEHCDEDNDHRITIAELGRCLKLHKTRIVTLAFDYNTSTNTRATPAPAVTPTSRVAGVNNDTSNEVEDRCQEFIHDPNMD